MTRNNAKTATDKTHTYTHTHTDYKLHIVNFNQKLKQRFISSALAFENSPLSDSKLLCRLFIIHSSDICKVSSNIRIRSAMLRFSLVELLQGGTGGLSVLRTFRLLRILKLVRFLPALRYQLFVMLKTMDNVATFFALLVLFIFIFRYSTHSSRG